MLETHDAIEARILELGALRREDFISAGGVPASLKLEMDVIYDDPELYDVIFGRMATLAVRLRPDFLVSAPTGGDRLTQDISGVLKIPFAVPTKRHDRKIVEPQSEIVKATLLHKKRGVIIDDIFTSGSTMQQIHKLPLFKDRIVGGAVIWDRGLIDTPNSNLPFPVRSVVKKHIPLT